MRIAVTRPLPDGERTAAALRAQGHDALIAPLMRVEAIGADLRGEFSGVIITSANAPRAIADRPRFAALKRLPLFAVGRRSAESARQCGFEHVTSADADARALVRLIAACHRDTGPLLYLAGQERAADLEGELAQKGIAVKTAAVYRAVALPYPPLLCEALGARAVDAVLHFSARSAASYVAGAEAAGLLMAALAPRHLCLSAQAAAPLLAAGAAGIETAATPDEAALLALAARAQA